MKKIILCTFFLIQSIIGFSQVFTDIVILPNAQSRTDFFCPNENVIIKYIGTNITGNVSFILNRTVSYTATCNGFPVSGTDRQEIASGVSATDTKTLVTPNVFDFGVQFTEPGGFGCTNKVLRVTGFSVRVVNSLAQREESIHLYSNTNCRGTQIQASKTTVLPGETITLSATKCYGIVKWNDGVTGFGATGATRSVVINQNTTYSADCTLGNIIFDGSNAISIIVCEPPVLTITNPPTVEAPNTVDITASSITAGSVLPSGTALSYHTNAQGTISLPNPSMISQSNTYYIKATTTSGCEVIRPVIVTINSCTSAISLISPTDDYNDTSITKQSNNTITASNKITGASNVTYRSNKSITLSPDTNGFAVANGAVFKAEIGGCL